MKGIKQNNEFLPDIEVLNRNFFDRFDKIKEFCEISNGLDYKLIRGKSSHSLSKVVAFAALVVSGIFVFYLLPKTDFNPHLVYKILIFAVFILFSGMLSIAFNKLMIFRHKRKFEAAAKDFFDTALTGDWKAEINLAAVKVWSKKNENNPFLRTLVKNAELHIQSRNLDRALITSYEKQIDKIYKDALRELSEAEKEQASYDMKIWKERIMKKDVIMQELKESLYNPVLSFNESEKAKLRKELLPLTNGLSRFEMVLEQNSFGIEDNPAAPLEGNLYIAASANHLVLLLGKIIKETRDAAGLLINHTRVYAGSALYIIPPEFIKRLEKLSYKDLTVIEFVESLNGIKVRTATSEKEGRKEKADKFKADSLKELWLRLDDKQTETLEPNFELLAPKTVLDPTCPLCVRFSDIHERRAKDGKLLYTCSSCKTNFSWKADYLRRIKLFPWDKTENWI